MPAIAPAAFERMRADTWLMPAMSTTEYIIVTSTAPTYGRVSPEASVETISFGTPTGSSRMACVAIEEPPEPPRASDPVETSLGVEPFHDRRRPPCHRLDGRPAVPLGGECRDVGAGGRRDLLHAPRPRRSTARRGRRRRRAGRRSRARARGRQEGVLLPLRVQSPDEDDGRHEVGGAGRMRSGPYTLPGKHSLHIARLAGRMRSGPYTARMMRLRIIRARRG